MGIMWTVKHSNEALAISLAQAHVSRVQADGGTGTDLSLITTWVRLLLDLNLWNIVGLSWEMPFGYKLTAGKIEKFYTLKGTDPAQPTASKQATLTTGQNSRAAAQFTAASLTHYRGITALPVANNALSFLANFHCTALNRNGLVALEKNATDVTPFEEFSFEVFTDGDNWQVYRGNGTSFDQGPTPGNNTTGVGFPRQFNTLFYQLGGSDGILGTQYKALAANNFGNSYGGNAYSHYILGGRGASNMMTGLNYGTHLLAGKPTLAQLTSLNNFWRTYYGV